MEFSRLREPIQKVGPGKYVIGDNPLQPQLTLDNDKVHVPTTLTISGVDFLDYFTGNPGLVNLIENTIQDLSSPFIFFSDAVDNIGVTQKDFYETPTPDTQLSGVTVAVAEDMRFTLQWDGPDDEYVGIAKINGQQIEFNNITELGTDTRRFEGFIDNLNTEGLTGITGEANGRQVILPLTEVGAGPTPTNVYIDEISTATPKTGELLGATHLKEGDSINIYAEFNRDDIELIKVHDHGLAQQVNFASYTLEDLGGIYRATIPVLVSNREGDLSVSVQAIDGFGTTGETRESSDFYTH